MIIELWAKKWNIETDAVNDLLSQFGIDDVATVTDVAIGNGSEKSILNSVRLEASQKGWRLWRNNIGAFLTADNRFIRYGLANDSEKLNKIIKSSDLIGIKPFLITEKHIGMIVGQFTARETKCENWKYRGNEHELAQLRFIELVNVLGGDAAFVNKKGAL